MKQIAQVLPGEQLGSLTYNYWRTAENRTFCMVKNIVLSILTRYKHL